MTQTNAVYAAAIVFLFIGCSKSSPQPKTMFDTTKGLVEKQQCLAGAKSTLGEPAIVVRCGDLTGGGGLEALAVMPLPGVPQKKEEVSASRVVIIRQQESQWIVELDAQKQIRNPEGYVGIDFIDHSPSRGYLLGVADRSGETGRFTLWLTYLNDQSEEEGTAVEVSWNPAVHRFQEFAANEDPVGFKPEIKNPPHLKRCAEMPEKRCQ